MLTISFYISILLQYDFTDDTVFTRLICGFDLVIKKKRWLGGTDTTATIIHDIL